MRKSRTTVKQAQLDAAYKVAHWYRELALSSNAAFMPLYFDSHRYLVLKGGGGSGKSVFAARKVIERAVCEPGHRFLVCRKVGRTLRESCFRLIRAQLDKYYPVLKVKINKSEMTITFPNGSEILFAGLDDVEKLKSIYEITDIWIEEASELLESDFNQLDIRMRGASKYYRQIIITFNPISILHWLKRRFFDVSDPEALMRIRTHESTYRDNKWLTDEDRRTLELFRNTDEYYYNVYCLGQWGVTGKTVFDAKQLSMRLSQLPSQNINGGAKRLGAFEYVWENERIKDGSRKYVDSPAGFIKIYRDVERGVPYVIGADTAGDGSDSFVAQVLDNRTGEQVATMRCAMDEDLFTKQLYCLGRYYNDALTAPEINFSTYPVRELQRLNYPRLFVRDIVDSYTKSTTKQFGFRTDTKTRPVIIAELVKVVREHAELINDYTTISEMLTFVRDDTFKPCAADGAHDDTVMALAIAHYLRPYQSCVTEEIPGITVDWHSSQWEDYNNASPDEKAMLIKRWGRPKGM